MYEFRLQEPLKEGLSLEQIRGLEGVRVRTAYSRLSKAETTNSVSGKKPIPLTVLSLLPIAAFTPFAKLL